LRFELLSEGRYNNAGRSRPRRERKAREHPAKRAVRGRKKRR